MKKVLLVLVALVLLAVGGGYWWLESTLHSSSFVDQLEGYMSEVVAAPVEIEGVELINLSSAKMDGFKIPLNFAKNEQMKAPVAHPAAVPVLVLAAASKVVFDGVPQMQGAGTMAKLEIDAPVVWLEQLDDGAIAWPKFSTHLPEGSPVPSITFKEVAITNAKVSITGKDGFTSMLMEEVDVTGAFMMTRGALSGAGQLSAKRVVLGGKIVIHDLTTPVVATPDKMELTDMQGTLYGGTLTGKMTITPRPSSQPIRLEFSAKDVDSVAFLKDIGLASTLKIGRVALDFSGEGELLEPLMIAGSGHFKTSAFDGDGVPVIANMQKMARDLNLAAVNFESLVGKLATDQGVVTFTNVESLPANQSRLFAHGTVDLDGNLNLAGSLELEGGVVGSVEKFFREAGFIKKNQSLVTKKFKVTGTTAHPIVDM